MAHAMADWFSWLRMPTIAIDPPAVMVIMLAGATAGFALARVILGLGEAGNFPASIKTVAEWFPKRERALATGIFNSGTNVGALVTPIVVPWIALQWGWQWAFIATGLLGFVWVVFWLVSYGAPEKHTWVSAEELAHIQSDPTESTQQIAWSQLFPHPQLWAFALGKFLTDPIWWLLIQSQCLSGRPPVITFEQRSQLVSLACGGEAIRCGNLVAADEPVAREHLDGVAPRAAAEQWSYTHFLSYLLPDLGCQPVPRLLQLIFCFRCRFGFGHNVCNQPGHITVVSCIWRRTVRIKLGDTLV